MSTAVRDVRSLISPLAFGGVFVALLLELIFAVSYIGALHEPTPHDLPFGVVAPPHVAQRLTGQITAQTGSSFSPRVEGSVQALQHDIDQRSIYGGLVLTQTGVRMIVADAASTTAAQALETFAQGFAAAQKMKLTIQHVHRLPASDPRGLSITYLVFAWVFGGYFCATVLSTIRGSDYQSRFHAVLRLLLLASFAILSGLLGAAITEPLIGAFHGHILAIAAAGMLLVFAVATFTMALQLFLGIGGTLMVLVAFVLVGNPSSGGVAPGEFLPPFWRVIGPWLPNSAGITLVRNIEYFSANAIGGALVLLAVYAVLGCAALLLFATRRRPTSPLSAEMEDELATAAGAGA